MRSPLNPSPNQEPKSYLLSSAKVISEISPLPSLTASML